MTRFSLNNVRLRNKLLILYIFAVLLPIIFTNVIFYQVTSTNVKKQKMHDITLSLEQTKLDFEGVMNDVIGVSSEFYTDSLLNEFLEKEYASAIDYVEAYDQYVRGYNRYSPIHYSIQSIKLYTDNPSVIYSGGVYPISDEVKRTEWYQKMMEGNPYPIVTVSRNHLGSPEFSIIRNLDYFKNSHSRQKILKIDLNPITVNQIFKNLTLQGDVFLINEHNQIEYTTADGLEWKTELISFDSISIPKGYIQLQESFSRNYIQHWKLVGVISEKELIDEVRNSREFIFYLACLNILLPTAILIWISKSLHTRLIRILRHMKKMKNQRFDLIEGVEHRDEIGQLTSEFNRMSQKIKELIHDVFVANIQKKDLELQRKQAQLDALRSQINPHFLFNALETIRMRSLIKKEEETAKIIQNLARIFRRSLTWGKDWVTVREELNLILCFLEIQKYRFEDKLDYEIHIDEAAYDCLIPNMAFIPFVENASIHGIERVKGKGMISLRVEKQGDRLLYTLKDNGGGMPKEKVEKILHALQQEEDIGENVGMKNVYYRLKMYYGEAFHFHMESAPGEGTIIEMGLPLNQGAKAS